MVGVYIHEILVFFVTQTFHFIALIVHFSLQCPQLVLQR